jgi:hypothetical protein
MRLLADKFEDGGWFIYDADQLNDVPESERDQYVRTAHSGYADEQEALAAIAEIEKSVWLTREFGEMQESIRARGEDRIANKTGKF